MSDYDVHGKTFISSFSLKFVSPQQTFPLCFSIFRERPKHCIGLTAFLLKNHFLFGSKDRESRHSLNHDRAIKGNGFDSGLT